MSQNQWSYLQDGETVLWQAGSRNFPLLDRVTKKTLVIRWGATAAVSLGLLGVYLINNPVPNPFFIILVLAIAAMVCLSPLLERYQLLGQTYLLTNRRAIVTTRANDVYAIPLHNLPDWQVEKELADCDCLILGKCLFEDARKQMRWRACHPLLIRRSDPDMELTGGMVFYCPQRLDEAISILEEFQRKTGMGKVS